MNEKGLCIRSTFDTPLFCSYPHPLGDIWE